MKLEEITLNEEYLFKGKIINLRRDEVELPNKKTSMREVVEHPGGVCVLPLTKDNEILFVKQFRYPYKKVLLEIPAGKRDKKDEAPVECGKRELKEETGTTAKEYISLGELYPTPGYVDEVIYMFLAKGLEYGETCPDEDEFLSIEKIPFKEALKMVLDGSIKDAKTQVAIMKTALLMNLN